MLPYEVKGAVPEGGPRFIDNRSFNGPIPWMVVDAVDAIARNMRVGANVRGVGREDVYEYPVEALQLRRSGTASVKFSNAISHFTVVFSRAERHATATADTATTDSRAAEGRAADILPL